MHGAKGLSLLLSWQGGLPLFLSLSLFLSNSLRQHHAGKPMADAFFGSLAGRICAQVDVQQGAGQLWAGNGANLQRSSRCGEAENEARARRSGRAALRGLDEQGAACKVAVTQRVG